MSSVKINNEKLVVLNRIEPSIFLFFANRPSLLQVAARWRSIQSTVNLSGHLFRSAFAPLRRRGRSWKPTWSTYPQRTDIKRYTLISVCRRPWRVGTTW